MAGFVGDRLGIAVEFVEETPWQGRLREFDAGRLTLYLTQHALRMSAPHIESVAMVAVMSDGP